MGVCRFRFWGLGLRVTKGSSKGLDKGFTVWCRVWVTIRGLRVWSLGSGCWPRVQLSTEPARTLTMYSSPYCKKSDKKAMYCFCTCRAVGP